MTGINSEEGKLWAAGVRQKKKLSNVHMIKVFKGNLEKTDLRLFDGSHHPTTGWRYGPTVKRWSLTAPPQKG